jgi:hypothetical protein
MSILKHLLHFEFVLVRNSQPFENITDSML